MKKEKKNKSKVSEGVLLYPNGQEAHLKKLVEKIRKLEMETKRLKENARIEKMEKDFND